MQNNAFNNSRIATAVVVALTTSMHLSRAFGNVILHKGEAGLPQSCVANISQITTIDRTLLKEKIGTLSQRRLQEILQGIYGLLKPLA